MDLETALARIEELEKRIKKVEEDIKDLYDDSDFEQKTEYEHYIEQARDHMWK